VELAVELAVEQGLLACLLLVAVQPSAWALPVDVQLLALAFLLALLGLLEDDPSAYPLGAFHA
jgi:hypothetical protein